MKIGIIGSGNIGGTLGKHWAKAGHEVLFSSRHPEELNSLVHDAGKNAKAVSVAEAFEAKADAYLLAVPFKEVNRIAEVFAGEYGQKVVIDATNPYPDRDGDIAQEVRDSNRNATEYTAIKFSTALTSKAFNTIHAEHLKKRAFRDTEKLAVPYAAQDEKSREVTRQLIEDIGMDAVYVGDLSATKAMEVDQGVYGVSTSKSELAEKLSN
ncbi:NAD(P)-binding domain-containing protein [Zeaxanthinibacter sp. PT1]|uniref:NADPH-dependent F420 reductase n=1 Tax=Zeaxanthinibacter TaxID=561554 RepID=UPI00234B57A8|nr:NAD(P)-binding domain-containing protein [Zeaxanthinibacter sp. PT1]MDC6351479.1 NAD(P)-binding domain-containing protein [Zeaxanthinibacter sp. PT1]